MLIPVEGRTRFPTYGKGAYGYRRSPTHVHQGIDMSAPAGTRVLAALPGVVVKVVEPGTRGFSGYGRAVVVRSAGGVHALYAHLGAVAVSVGERVTEGQPIAAVGASCGTVANPRLQCRGAHLHFELAPRPYPMRSEASRLDPVAFKKKL